MRNTVLFFLLLATAASLSAAPAVLTIVRADEARAGILIYGRTESYLLAAAGGAGDAIALRPETPAYVAWIPRPEAAERVRRVAPFLFEDGRAALVQLDEESVNRAALAGAELVRLPDKPYPFRLAAPGSYPRPALADTFVQRLLGRISPDSIRRQIKRLEDFRTRYSPAESCRAAEQYVFDYFTALGLDSVQLDSYDYHGQTWRNVVGTRLGRRDPDKITIICGHMDGTSETPDTYAPAAEDNASGTAMAIEAARIMAHEDLDNTVKFIAFTGEEQGLIGSFSYAERMRGRNADIIGVVNFDMIAYPGGEFGVALFCDTASLSLARFEAAMAEQYTTLDCAVHVAGYGSDQLSFQAYGYRATAAGEYGNSLPWYHTTGDTIGNLSMPLAAEVAKMGIATLATLAVAPGPPDSFVLADAGVGATLAASWRAGSESDISGYKLFWGTNPGAYTDSLAVGLVTAYSITGLQNGTRYYAAVCALDSSGHLSGYSREGNAIPGNVPLAPAGVTALPFHYGVALSWRPNAERDLAGYNLYRSTVSGSGYAKINPSLLPDTSYRDSGLLSDTMYYYVAAAQDTSGNEGPRSAEVRSKPVTRDHGILLVDETRDGSGQRGSPNDAQVDDFYHALLQGFRYTDWDATVSGVPLAGDVGPYSTIVWHADDYTQQEIRPAVPGLANLLAQGGSLWLVGWKPVLGLHGIGRYPFTFAPGSFGYEQLHLDKGGQSEGLNFTGATGMTGYPSLNVDSAKLFPSFQGRLPFADVLYPRDAEVVLTFNSALGDSFQGKPVGVRWLTGPGKVMMCGFPLYYTVESQARQLALKALDDFGEPYGIEEGRQLTAHSSQLLATIVRNVLFLPKSTSPSSSTSLLDISGRRVLSLKPGRNDLSRLAPGVYFVRCEGRGAGETVRKVALLD